MSVPKLGPTEDVLTRVMNMRQIREYPVSAISANTVHVFEMGEGGASAELHVAVEPDPAGGARGRRRRASCRLPHARL